MTQIPKLTPGRDTLLLCHANPEDNEFTLWLALQLANEGYRVWCDLTKLLGGKVFWDNIEEVIKTRAAKVLYVLSQISNVKDLSDHPKPAIWRPLRDIDDGVRRCSLSRYGQCLE